ncbi:MAG: DUF1501 domain-containing protein, partial [Bdellovibrionales bacterium]|nr:DUF1501 domain-containing protein [Bdellovibrionales bacterium]
VNGVLMATSFDGHPQNMNFLFSGNPFGGDSYLPHISDKSSLEKTPITGIQSGNVFAQLNNHSSIIPLTGNAGAKMSQLLKSTPEADLNNPVIDYINRRYQANSQGQGRFSKANKILLKAIGEQQSLAQKLKAIEFSNDDGGIQGTIEMLSHMFKQKVARLALMVIDVGDLQVDTHAGQDAQAQPELYTLVSEQIAQIINLLRTTPYDSQRSLYDVSTFVVSSEFGRTMRQQGLSMEQTGTDHNPLSNSFFIGGKGIRTGQVIGRSDYQSSNEKLSAVHESFDRNKLKVMGTTFDFQAMKPTDLKPEEFDVKQYLSMANIANTVMKSFSVDPSVYWTTARLDPPAPVITSLLK